MAEELKYSRLAKELMEKELERSLSEGSNIIIANYQGLSANDVNEFRQTMKKAESRFLVVKNRHCKRVLKRNELDALTGMVSGECGLTFIRGDVVQAAKAVLDFSKSHQPLVVRGGYIDGTAVDADKLKDLASLPSREVLLAMLLAGMKAPITGFVGVLSGVLRSLIYALNAIKDKKGEGGKENG